MVKLGEMGEEPGKGGETDAEIPAAAGTLFTVAAVAAVLSFGGGPAAGAGGAAHQQALVSGAAGAAVGSAAADGSAALQRDDGAHQQPQRHSLRGGGCRARQNRKAGCRPAGADGLFGVPHSQPHRAGSAGTACPAERDDRPCGHGPDHHSGHSGGGHRRGKRHRAGLCGGVAFQPHLRKTVLWHDHPALFGPAVVVFVSVGAGGGTGAGVLLRLPAAAAGGQRPHGLDRGFRERGCVPLRLSGTAAHPHRPASPHLYALPVLFAGRQPDRRLCDLHGCLHRLHDRVHHGPAPLRRHRLDVHRLHQDLWLSGHCGGLHLHGPQGEPCPYRRRHDPAGGHGLGGLHHRAH